MALSKEQLTLSGINYVVRLRAAGYQVSDALGNLQNFIDNDAIPVGSDLSTAIAALGATSRVVYFCSTDAPQLNADTTIPANAVCLFDKGALIDLNGYTLTFECEVQAGLFQIFDFSSGGSVVFEPALQKEIFPHWFGTCAGDGSTDCTTAIQRAATALEAMGEGTLTFPGGTYLISVGDDETAIDLDSCTDITIKGKNATLLTEDYADGTGIDIYTLTRSGTTCTCTTTSAHGLSTSDYVVIKGCATDTNYNGYFQVTVVSPTVFTFTALSAPAADLTDEGEAWEPNTTRSFITLTACSRVTVQGLGFQGDGFPAVTQKYVGYEAVNSDTPVDIVGCTFSSVSSLGCRSRKPLDVRDFGAVGDGSNDDTAAIQAALTASDGGGTVVIPRASTYYKVTSTLTIPKGCSILGGGRHNFSPTESGAYIRFVPDTECDLFQLADAQAFGYLGGVSFENLNIVGDSTNANARYAFNLYLPYNLKMKSVQVQSFDEALYLDTTLQCHFEQCDFRSCDVGVRFTGGISTSTIFSNCYIHFNTTPLIMEAGTGLGIIFTDQTIFESCTNGLDIYPGNRLEFHGCYTENVPSTATATSIFNFGVSGDAEVGYARGSCLVSGCNIGGFNGTHHVDSVAFNVDKWGELIVVGSLIDRVGNSVAITSNTKGVNFIGCFEQGVTTSLKSVDDVMYSNLRSTLDATSHYRTATGDLYLRAQGRTGKVWKLTPQYGVTDSDLDVLHEDTQVARFDASGNIHLCGAIDPNGATNQVLFPPNTVTAGTIGNNASLFCETSDSAATIRLKRGDGNSGIVQAALYGSTANRPTSGRGSGVQYYDTDTNQLIIWNNGAWRLVRQNNGIGTFSDGDATPSAVGYETFKTANTGATTITDFDDGVTGQRITVIVGDANTTFDFTSSGLKGNGGVDLTPAAGDVLEFIYDGTDWLMTSYADNT